MIKILPYQTNWPSDFESEKKCLQQELANLAIKIEHAGSTAVKNMCAKPIIDIVIGVESLRESSSQFIEKMLLLGYEYIQSYEEFIPERRYFKKRGKNTSYNVHVAEIDSDFYHDIIAFRDRLRSNPTLTKAYKTLKLELSKNYNDVHEYSHAKSDFILNVLRGSDPIRVKIYGLRTKFTLKP